VTMKLKTFALLASLSTVMSGCGVAEQGQSPSQVAITALQASTGGGTLQFVGVLLSDVCVIVTAPTCTIFDDFGRVSMNLRLKDPGSPGVTNAPSPLNDVTFTRYHVEYVRADGRNTPGVDVPFPFDGGATFTVNSQGGTATFELVRHVAKLEAPLAALSSDLSVITTIANITFYGKDQGGKNVAVTGSILVNFGNFADSTN
jgi:hypothetical protein